MDLGLLQREVAAHFKVCTQTYRNWELGHRRPRPRYLPAMRRMLDEPRSESLGDQLREVRWRLGMSQQELAKLLGVNRCTVTSWERGAHEPTRRHWGRIIDLLRDQELTS